MSKIKIFMLFIFTTFTAMSMEITLEQAVELSYKNNVNVINAEKDLENYELSKKEAFSSALPKLTYSGSASIMQEQIVSTNNDSDNLYSHSIDLSQSVYSGGKIKTAIELADIYNEIGVLNFEKIKKTTRLEIINAYLEIIKLEKSKKLYADSLSELNEQLFEIKEMYSLGMVSKTSVLQLEYQSIEMKSTIEQLKNSIEVSKLSLKNQIGISESEEIKLKEINIVEENIQDRNFDEDIEYGIENSVDAKIAKLSTLIQKGSETIEKSDLLPEVDASLSYGSSEYTVSDSLSNDEWEWKATLSFSFDLWDWNVDRNELKRAKNETKKMEETEKDTLKNIELSIRSEYLELFRLAILLEAKNEALESSEENYRLEKERYSEGLISTIDFLAAKNSLTTSQVDVASAEIDLYYAYQVYLDSIELN